MVTWFFFTDFTNKPTDFWLGCNLKYKLQDWPSGPMAYLYLYFSWSFHNQNGCEKLFWKDLKCGKWETTSSNIAQTSSYMTWVSYQFNHPWFFLSIVLSVLTIEQLSFFELKDSLHWILFYSFFHFFLSQVFNTN